MKLQKHLILALAFMLTFSNLFSQKLVSENNPAWRVGLDLGLSYNMAGVGYQNLYGNGGNFVPLVMVDGTGIAPFIGLRGEYLSTDWWGVLVRASYDSRNASVTDETNTPNAKIDASASYLSIETMLSMKQDFIPNLRPHLGPLFAFNLSNEYEVTEPSAVQSPAKEIAEFSGFAYGFTFGFDYDILVSDAKSNKRWYVVPFLDASFLAGQKAKDFPSLQDGFDDTWSTFSLRAGASIALEFVEGMPSQAATQNFTLQTPADGVVRQRTVEQYLPLANHVFFDEGKQEIPSRYELLSASEGANFTEASISDLASIQRLNKSNNPERQLYVYHNLLNILGYRMRQNPSETVNLIGSAPVANDGDVLANKVKEYLVKTMGIDESRITVSFQELPRIVSGSAATPQADRPLVDAENRRVELVFNNPKMTEPIKIKYLDETSVDNDIIISINPNLSYKNWVISLNGEGKNLTFGPFEDNVERINPAELMKGLDEGDYEAQIVIYDNNGGQISESTDFNLRKEWDKAELGQRHVIIFNYGQKDAVKSYENLLRNTIAPGIAEGNKLLIHGHTDAVGSEKGNKDLSKSRAGEVRDIFTSQFQTLGKRINVQSFGYGEENMPETFDNSLPEGRFYNRNVTLDIVPLRKK